MGVKFGAEHELKNGKATGSLATSLEDMAVFKTDSSFINFSHKKGALTNRVKLVTGQKYIFV